LAERVTNVVAVDPFHSHYLVSDFEKKRGVNLPLTTSNQK
ncbi:hypothetical protein LCGC14_1649450, partial [marine sediment metagenome]